MHLLLGGGESHGSVGGSGPAPPSRHKKRARAATSSVGGVLFGHRLKSPNLCKVITKFGS